MKNEEPKEKMVKIIINAIWKDAEADYDSTDESEAISIADALIEAGYGDVKEAEAEANRYEMLYKLQNRDMALAERRVHDAEHRAEVAERALKICLIDNLYCYECERGFDGKCKETDKEKEECAMIDADYYIQQAEKELTEEREDD